MRVGILSGKGGAGKTLLSVNLSSLDDYATYIDCDVEEPNGHLYFKPTEVQSNEVTIKIPEIDNSLCNGCRTCTEFCSFNALAYTKDQVIVFEEVCHSCGGCSLFCPTNAIGEKEKVIGYINEGFSDETRVISGCLNIGEVTGVPIIDRLNKKAALQSGNVYIDCPPGSACSVMESIKGVDFCIIVAEPTIYGLHNMKMVYELVTKFNKPLGVVINKSLTKNNPVNQFCSQNRIKVLGDIPFDTELGEINSNAFIAVKESDKYSTLFSDILQRLKKEVSYEAVTHS